MLYICSDHGGFELKEKLITYLRGKDIEVEDVGPFALNPTDDFPDYVKPLVNKVLGDTMNKGIMICRNGVGVTIMANKFKGIRAGLSWNPKHAISAKNDDNTNVLALPADYIDLSTACETVSVWLQTETSRDPRFLRRQAKAESTRL